MVRLYFAETFITLGALSLAQGFYLTEKARREEDVIGGGDDVCGCWLRCLVEETAHSNMSESTQVKAASPEKDEKDSREPRAEFHTGDDERDPEEVSQTTTLLTNAKPSPSRPNS